MGFRKFFGRDNALSPTEKSSVGGKDKKRESYTFESFFLKKSVTDELLTAYSGLSLTESKEMGKRKSISTDDSKNSSLSQASAAASSPDGDSPTSLGNSRSTSRSSFIAENPGGFTRNLLASFYHFEDITAEGKLADKKQITVTVISEKPSIGYYKKNGNYHQKPIEDLKKEWSEDAQEPKEPELDGILLTYFRSAEKVAQIKKLGQNLFGGSLLDYLQLTNEEKDELKPHNPAGQIVFVRMKGNTPDQDRFFIRLRAINDTIRIEKEGDITFKLRDKEKITDNDNMNKSAQGAMRDKNKDHNVSEYAFSSIDQTYELEFNGKDQGPNFISIPSCPPILSVYSQYMLPPDSNERVGRKSDNLSPDARFLGFVTDMAESPDLKYSLPSHPPKTPIPSFELDSKNSVLDIKLATENPEKDKWVSHFDAKSSSASLSRVFDTAKPIESVTTHLSRIFEQIRVDEFPDHQSMAFNNELQRSRHESIFDEQGNFSPWVLNMLKTNEPPAAQEDIQLLCRFLKNSLDIAFRGTYTNQGQFQQWIGDFLGENPTKNYSRLMLAEKELGGDADRGIFGNLVSWVSVLPPGIVETDGEKNVASIITRLIQHQLRNTNFEFLHAARTLNRFIENKRHELFHLEEIKVFFADVNQALQRMPLGRLDNPERFILLANLASEALTLDPNSIAYFYALENFKEQTREFNKEKLAKVQEELGKKDIPTEIMWGYSRDKFQAIPVQDGHELHSLITDVKLETKSRAETMRLKKEEKNSAPYSNRAKNKKDLESSSDSSTSEKPLDISIKRLPLIYQLATETDKKKMEFAQQILTLIEKEESLGNKDKLRSVFENAITEYNTSLTDPTNANPEKFTPLLQLINTILELNDVKAVSYLLPTVNIIIDDFNKIKDSPDKLVAFNAHINQLLLALPAEEKEEKQEELNKRFSAFITLTVKKEIDNIAGSAECKALQEYEYRTQGWTMWLLTFIGLHDKGHDVRDFLGLLASENLQEKFIFFQTIQMIACGSNKEEKDEKEVKEINKENDIINTTSAVKDAEEKEQNKEFTAKQRVHQWQTRLTMVRNPIYRMYQFFCGPVNVKSTTEEKIIELYKNNKDTIEKALKELPFK